MTVLQLPSHWQSVPSALYDLWRRSLTPRPLAFGFATFWAILAGAFFNAHDAVTYLAAGERLNAGHALYALSPGDRPIPLDPPYWDVPLLSPPLVAVAFRLLALFPSELGMWLWWAAGVACITGTVIYLVREPTDLVLIAPCSIGLGFALISGNVANFLLVGYVLIWRYRDRPWVGALIGVMAVAKLFPIVFVAFLVARRDARQLLWLGAGTLVATTISVLGAGFDAHLAYIGVIERSAPQFASLAYLTGIGGLSVVLFAAGALLAMRVREAWSYAICLITLVFAAPTLAWAQLVALLPLLMLTWPIAESTALPRGQSIGAVGHRDSGLFL